MKQRNIILALTLTVLLLPGVVALEITSSPERDGKVNEVYTYNVTADQDNVTFNLTESPEDMTIDSEGLINWTPTEAGDFNVEVRVANGTIGENNTATASQNFTIEVEGLSPGQFNADSLDLGGEDTERDRVLTQQYEIENTGEQEITNIEGSLRDIPNRYEVSILSTPSTISPGETEEMTIEYFIPLDQDSGQERIGRIDLTGETDGEEISLTRNVNIEAQNGIRIRGVDVRIDGRRTSATDGDTLRRDAQIGDEIEVSVDLENVLDNVDMRDVDVFLNSRDLEEADGLDDRIRLDAGERNEVEFVFEIDPETVDIRNTPFRIEIDVEAEDRERANHERNFNFRLDLDLEDEDLRIVESRLRDVTLRCGQENLRLETDVRNLGEDTLRNAMVEFESAELGFSEFERRIRVSRGDRERVETNIRLDTFPSAGEYLVEILAYPTENTRTISDSNFITVSVPSCGQDDTDEEEDVTPEPEDPETQPIQVTGTPVISESGTLQESDEDRDTLYILAGLVAVLIVTTGWVLRKVLS